MKGSPWKIKEKAQLWEVKMNLDDELFYQNKCLYPQIKYCTNFATYWDIIAQNAKKKNVKSI